MGGGRGGEGQRVLQQLKNMNRFLSDTVADSFKISFEALTFVARQILQNLIGNRRTILVPHLVQKKCEAMSVGL